VCFSSQIDEKELRRKSYAFGRLLVDDPDKRAKKAVPGVKECLEDV